MIPVGVGWHCFRTISIRRMKNHMQIEFWGVRGSIATPGPETALVGGNTSCVEVRCGGKRIILDAGTGLRRLGDRLVAEMAKSGEAIDVNLLLSHFHWDHIQGLPFFAPAYIPTSRIAMWGAHAGTMSLGETLHHQMQAPVFPVRLDELGAKLELNDLRAGRPVAIGEVTVRAAKLNHPGGVHAFRIEHRGRAVVYATDTEHYACLDPQLVALAQGADVLIYDSQYTEEEYAKKVGWGHSTYVRGCQIARAAGVTQFVLYHHDPARSDAMVAELEARARDLFPESVAAREGMTIELGEMSSPGKRGGRAADLVAA
jgi:phosphoribosyl 1,2-cyclic phosphodiesterase